MSSYGTGGTQAHARDEYMENRIRTASREQLLLITYDIGINACGKAAAAMMTGDNDETNEYLKRAQSVLRELMITLRVSGENPATASLMSLYDFMHTTLVEANVQKDPEKVTVVRSMLEELKETWGEAMQAVAAEQSQTGTEHYSAMGASVNLGLNIHG